MHVADTLALFGWAFTSGSWAPPIQAFVVAAVFHLRIVPGAESWLRQLADTRRQQSLIDEHGEVCDLAIHEIFPSTSFSDYSHHSGNGGIALVLQ